MGAGAGLVEAGNPTNEVIYQTPGEYLDFGSPRHPASVYRLVVRYDTEGSPDRGALMLGAVQLRRGSERIVVDGVTLLRRVTMVLHDGRVDRVIYPVFPPENAAADALAALRA